MSNEKFITLDEKSQNAGYVILSNKLMIQRLLDELLALVAFQQGMISINASYSLHDEYELHSNIIRYIDLCISSIYILQKSGYLGKKLNFPIEYILLREYRNYHQHTGVGHFKPVIIEGDKENARFYIYPVLQSIPEIKKLFPGWCSVANKVEISELLNKNQLFINDLIILSESNLHKNGIGVKFPSEYRYIVFGSGKYIQNSDSWKIDSNIKK